MWEIHVTYMQCLLLSSDIIWIFDWNNVILYCVDIFNTNEFVIYRHCCICVALVFPTLICAPFLHFNVSIFFFMCKNKHILFILFIIHNFTSYHFLFSAFTFLIICGSVCFWCRRFRIHVCVYYFQFLWIKGEVRKLDSVWGTSSGYLNM